MKNIIVSYQMGKVGSSSITESISDCVQLHTWSGKNPYYIFSTKYYGSFVGRALENLRWFNIFYKLNSRMSRGNEKLKILCGVRDPVARNVSGYFQALTSYKGPILSVEDAIINFYAETPHALPLNWFDIELKKALGVDVYNYSFDHVAGFSIIKEGRYEIFLYQQEKLSTLESELGLFLELEDFKLTKSNESSGKWYGNLYSEFKKSFSPQEEYIDFLYNSKYMKHFYSFEDIQRLRDKWIGEK